MECWMFPPDVAPAVKYELLKTISGNDKITFEEPKPFIRCDYPAPSVMVDDIPAWVELS